MNIGNCPSCKQFCFNDKLVTYYLDEPVQICRNCVIQDKFGGLGCTGSKSDNLDDDPAFITEDRSDVSDIL